MRNSNYFPHDYDSSTDGRIIKLRSKYGWKGYGIYWAIIEALAREDGYIDREAIGVAIGEANIQEVINYCLEIGLLKINGKKIFSKRLMEHIRLRKQFIEYGKKGAVHRWKLSDRGGNSPPIREGNSPPNSSKVKQSKVNILPKGNTQKREPVKDKHPLRPLVVHLQETLGTKITNWGKQLTATKMMKDAGYEDKEIKGMITYMFKYDQFFKGKGFDMMTVANNIDRLMIDLKKIIGKQKKEDYVSPFDKI